MAHPSFEGVAVHDEHIQGHQHAGIPLLVRQAHVALGTCVTGLDQGHAGLGRLAQLVECPACAVVQSAPAVEVAAQLARDLLGGAAELAKARIAAVIQAQHCGHVVVDLVRIARRLWHRQKAPPSIGAVHAHPTFQRASADRIAARSLIGLAGNGLRLRSRLSRCDARCQQLACATQAVHVHQLMNHVDQAHTRISHILLGLSRDACSRRRMFDSGADKGAHRWRVNHSQSGRACHRDLLCSDGGASFLGQTGRVVFQPATARATCTRAAFYSQRRELVSGAALGRRHARQARYFLSSEPSHQRFAADACVWRLAEAVRGFVGAARTS